MRRYFRPLLWTVFLSIGLTWCLFQLRYNVEKQVTNLQTQQNFNAPQMAIRIVYPLDEKKWIKFALPEKSEKIRIISNAHIDNTVTVMEDKTWNYSFSYQLLSIDGTLLTEQDYHQRSRLTLYQKPEKPRYYANYYATDQQFVLEGRIVYLNLKSFKNAAFMRLRIHDHVPEIKGIAIRLYTPIKISSHRIKKLWKRLSTKQQNTLANVSVFPAKMLSETEKINILKNQWHPLGPLGIEGEDYFSNILYTLKGISEDKIKSPLIVSGRQAGPDYPLIIPIPEQGGTVSLTFKMLDGSPMPDKLPVTLRWFGRTRQERWQKTSHWLNTQPLIHQVKGGLLEVRPSVNGVVKATLHTSTNEKLDITPKKLRIKSYFTETAVNFKIEHPNQQATPIRVDIRQFFSPDTAHLASATVRYEWLNQQKQPLHSGLLSITKSASRYDRLKSIVDKEKISDPDSYYWLLPAQVHYLRFKSAQKNSVINAYNHPLGMVKYSKIPEDAYLTLDKTAWRPSWFPFQPEQLNPIATQQRVLFIGGQIHPPQETADKLAGHYLWREYMPNKPYQAYHLFSRYEKNLLRDEALSAVYCQLTQQKTLSIHLQAPNQLQNFSPDLWFFNPHKKQQTLAVSIDGKKYLQRSLKGQQLQLPLNNLTSGHHRFTLTSSHSGHWFLNNMPECQGQRYLKRRIFKLKTPLTFLYQHRGDDALLSARFYRHIKNPQRTQIKVQIKAVNDHLPPPKMPTTRWTFTQRVYDLRSSIGEDSQLLHTAKRLNTGDSFFIPFNHDLAAGLYQVIFTTESTAEEIYLSVSEIIEGQHPLKQFYREVQFE